VYSLPEVTRNRFSLKAVVEGTGVGLAVLHYKFLTQLHGYVVVDSV
jgi:hypothetical protein